MCEFSENCFVIVIISSLGSWFFSRRKIVGKIVYMNVGFFWIIEDIIRLF